MAPKAKKAGRRATATADAPAESDKVGADVLLARLDEVVRDLEAGDLPLEQALARFEEGIHLVREGEQLLASVEQRIETLLADGTVAPFADDPESE